MPHCPSLSFSRTTQPNQPNQPPPPTNPPKQNKGGIQPEDMPAYIRAGALGFALGSTLYQPGLEPEELRRRARLFKDAVARGRETDAWAAATLGL
jgi:hypothetical protein